MDTTESANIYIPDISGFTNFVNEIEILHGQEIICELMEEIIDSNESALEISEIEGDAILFFKLGSPISNFDFRELNYIKFILIFLCLIGFYLFSVNNFKTRPLLKKEEMIYYIFAGYIHLQV